jgi:hypothetical protein
MSSSKKLSGGLFLVLRKEVFVITFIPTYSIIPGGTKTKTCPSSKPKVNINNWAYLETRRVRKMFFSVIKYYTKTNKNITLKQRETKNSFKKTKSNKTSVFSTVLLGNQNVKMKNFSALFARLR